MNTNNITIRIEKKEEYREVAYADYIDGKRDFSEVAAKYR